MSKKLTKEEFIEKANKKYNFKYDYSKVEFIDRKTKVIIICPEHGEYEQTPCQHLKKSNKTGCPKCGANLSLLKLKSSLEKFIQKAILKHGNKYDYSKVKYINNSTKVCIICPKHGEFLQSPNSHLQGIGCPMCAGRNKTTQDIIKIFKDIHGDKYDYSKVKYVNNETKVCIICPEHGEFWQTPHHHKNGIGCPLCGIKKNSDARTYTSAQFIEKAKQVHGNKYDYSNTFYTKSREQITIICPKHGVFQQLPNDHLTGHGCPSCASTMSQPENDIICHLKNLGISNIVQRNRQVLNGQEIDIYLPDFKFAIEYNGLYWHSESKGKDKWYHLNKTLNAQKKDITLIHIFEDEWLEHKDLILDKISHFIHKNTNQVVGARKCTITLIDHKIAKKFLDDYHIQGFATSSLYYGGFYNNELIGVMSFLKEKEGLWNLTRFATNYHYSIPGLANKIFKHFIDDNKNEIVKVKTFLDRRWYHTKDNLYTKLGFESTKIICPDYRYIVKNKRVHKFNFRKVTLHKKYGFPLTMTEKEMCHQLGFERIWDCGLIKYEWIASK